MLESLRRDGALLGDLCAGSEFDSCPLRDDLDDPVLKIPDLWRPGDDLNSRFADFCRRGGESALTETDGWRLGLDSTPHRPDF